MKRTNWDTVEEASEFKRIPAGAYVCKITDVRDVPTKECLEVYYDIAEGAQRGFFEDQPAWAAKFRKFYGERSRGFFKAFLAALERSNERFSIRRWQDESDERELIGLTFGAIIQERKYTNGKGEDKSMMDVYSVISADRVRGGDFTIPAVKDDRESVTPAAPAGGGGGAYAEEDIPF